MKEYLDYYKEYLIFRSEKRAIIALEKIQKIFGGELQYRFLSNDGKLARKTYHPNISADTLPSSSIICLAIGDEDIEYYDASGIEYWIHHSYRNLEIPLSIMHFKEIIEYLHEIWHEVNFRSLKYLMEFH